jgi:nucleoside-diphosphate-sugar epimerase
MKIIICGGGGFIGQRLASFLIDKGYEVIILDRNRIRISSPKLQSFVVDLLNPKRFQKEWFSGAESIINIMRKNLSMSLQTARG